MSTFKPMNLNIFCPLYLEIVFYNLHLALPITPLTYFFIENHEQVRNQH